MCIILVNLAVEIRAYEVYLELGTSHTQGLGTFFDKGGIKTPLVFSHSPAALASSCQHLRHPKNLGQAYRRTLQTHPACVSHRPVSSSADSLTSSQPSKSRLGLIYVSLHLLTHLVLTLVESSADIYEFLR